MESNGNTRRSTADDYLLGFVDQYEHYSAPLRYALLPCSSGAITFEGDIAFIEKPILSPDSRDSKTYIGKVSGVSLVSGARCIILFIPSSEYFEEQAARKWGLTEYKPTFCICDWDPYLDAHSLINFGSQAVQHGGVPVRALGYGRRVFGYCCICILDNFRQPLRPIREQADEICL